MLFVGFRIFGWVTSAMTRYSTGYCAVKSCPDLLENRVHCRNCGGSPQVLQIRASAFRVAQRMEDLPFLGFETVGATSFPLVSPDAGSFAPLRLREDRFFSAGADEGS